MVPFGALTTKPTSEVYEPSVFTIIWVLRLPCTTISTGEVEYPETKVLPKVPTILLFCLIPSTLPFHPSPYESDIVIVSFKFVGAGHTAIRQNVTKLVPVVKLFPLALWWMVVPLGALIVNPI